MIQENEANDGDQGSVSRAETTTGLQVSSVHSYFRRVNDLEDKAENFQIHQSSRIITKSH